MSESVRPSPALLDRSALLELFDYTTFTWASYGRALEALPPDAFARPIEGSGRPSLREALFHLAIAWDEWLAEQSGEPHRPIELSEINEWPQLDEFRQRLRAMLHTIMENSTDDQMKAPAFNNAPGLPAELSRSELLAHMLLHERGHHGDVSTLLHAIGADPPGVDYIVYAVWRNRQR